MQIPADLCPAHREIAKGWRDNHFDFRNPGEWPAGLSVTSGERTYLTTSLTTSRSGPHGTSFDEREAEFERKNREQVELTIRICRSGRSPQCTPGHRDDAVAAAVVGTTVESAVGDAQPLTPCRSARPITEVHLPDVDQVQLDLFA